MPRFADRRFVAVEEKVVRKVARVAQSSVEHIAEKVIGIIEDVKEEVVEQLQEVIADDEPVEVAAPVVAKAQQHYVKPNNRPNFKGKKK